MNQSMTRPQRSVRPALEGLEERELLSNAPADSLARLLNSYDPNVHRWVQSHARIVDRLNGVSLGDRQIQYTTPQGSHVTVTLYGVGSLAGSSIDPDGALNLVFSGTGPQTGIVGTVTGGNGQAPLRSIHHATLDPNDLSGIGSTVLNVVNLKSFNLVNNGIINLTGGVHSLYLNSVGQNTQVQLRELPASLMTNTTSSSVVNNGVTLAFITDETGARTLTSTNGFFVQGFNLLATNPPGGPATNGVNPGPPPAPAGVVLVIRHINGVPQSPNLEDPEVFGVDPTAGTLIRFDAATGNVLQTIPLTGMGAPVAGAAVSRYHGRLVALVGDGSSIHAFDAVTGDPVGSFSTANLASLGLSAIDGIGSTGTRAVVTDSKAGADGLALQIDVNASLDGGKAVAVGRPFAPSQQFQLSGGLTGIAGSPTIFATGAAHFDTFEPNQTQLGILDLSTAGKSLSEQSRTAIKEKGNYINYNPSTSPSQALGSIDQNLALVTAVAGGKNVVSLFNPSNFSSNGTITLNDPNLLSGLSESFRPNLAGAALVDVQGNVQSFRANDARGLVFNTAGYLNLAKIGSTSDSLLIGEPFLHAQMPRRSHVQILSTSRPPGARNGVTVESKLQQVGPLSLPG